MNALLLAAGMGTRLRPLTNKTPKCLVEIDGIPLLKFWLDKLIKQSCVNKIFVNTHYLPDQVDAFILNYKAKNKSANIEIKHEKELLGTGGTLKKIGEILAYEPLFFAHCDNLSVFPFSSFLHAFKSRPTNCDLTMMTFTTDNPSECGIVKTNKKNIVTQFHEKPKKPLGTMASAATFILEPSVVKKVLSTEHVYDFSRDILPLYVGRMNIWHNNLYHRDIGTLDAFRLANKEFFALTKNMNQ